MDQSDAATPPPPARATTFEVSQHNPLDLENRLTKLETTINLFKWVIGISVPVIAVVVQVVANVIGS